MASITIVLRDPATGAGLPNQTVKLRMGPGFGSDDYTLSDVAGKAGSYKVDDVITGTYKLYVNGVVDNSFGGNNGREIFRGQDILMKSGGAMTGVLDMNGQRITNLPDASSDGEPVKRGYGDGRYLQKSGGAMAGVLDMNGQKITNLPAPTGNTEPLRVLDGLDKRQTATEAQQVYSAVVFRSSVVRLTEPTGLLQLVNRKFVEEYVTRVLQGYNPSAYQQSNNIIRVIFSGVQEDNKVYRKLEEAIIAAALFATSSRHMIVVIEGNGADGLLPNHNLLLTGYDPYIHICGGGPGITLRVAEDIYNYTALGENIISNVILENENEAAVTNFSNVIFYGVEFKNLFGAGSFTFENCIFLGGCSFGESVTVELTDCIGELTSTHNNKKYVTYDLMSLNNFLISNSKGDIRGRRILGRYGSTVASAADITLGDGNYFRITGVTNTKRINTTDWTPGSRIILQFVGGLTFTNGETASGANVGVIFKDGADNVFNAGDYVELMLDHESSFWLELDKHLTP